MPSLNLIFPKKPTALTSSYKISPPPFILPSKTLRSSDARTLLRSIAGTRPDSVKRRSKMTEQQSSAFFPVVFFDGDRDVDIGSIAVTASLDFRKFQSMVAQKIGASPHQISISLVRRKKARSSPEIQRKVPIDESTDFAAIAHERDCFILVVMRRSRSGRRGRGRRGRGGGAEKKMEAAIDVVPEMTILKRNHQEDRVPIGSLGFWDYEAQLRNLQRMRERYMMSTALYYPYSQPPPVSVGGGGYVSPPATPPASVGGGAYVSPPATPPVFFRGGAYVSPPASPPVCEECAEAKRAGKSPGFHGCVYDRITVGFRTLAGPIERPTKRNAEASA